MSANDHAVSVFNVLTTISSITMSISPAPALYRIYKAKNTGQYQLIPLLAMFGNYLLWMIYGFFIHNIFPVVVTMAICSGLGLAYSFVFLYATDDRVKALKTFAVASVPVAVLIVYGILAGAGVTNQSDANIADVLGDLAVVTTLLFYTSPLVRIRTVLRTKSAASIPVAMCFMGSVNNAFWLTYGLLLDDMHMFIPNVVCCFFGIMQVLLYFKYRPTTDDLDTATNTDAAADIEEMSIRVVSSKCPKLQAQAQAQESPSFCAIASPITGINGQPTHRV